VTDGEDAKKAIVNLRKHRVSFAEAQSVLEDPLARWQIDASHSATEERWRVVGWSDSDRILVVTAVPRAGRFRTISARRATKRECHDYEG
jgi:hypothetical protein